MVFITITVTLSRIFGLAKPPEKTIRPIPRFPDVALGSQLFQVSGFLGARPWVKNHKKVRFAREKGSSHQAKMWIWAWKLGFLHEKLGVGYQKNVFFQETLERVLYFHLVQLFRKIVHSVHLLIRIVFVQYFWLHICALMFVLPFLHVAVLLYFYLI